MKPTIILDKSTFQCLSPKEMGYLNKFFIINAIEPLVAEIVGNLAKDPKECGGSVEEHISRLANKLQTLRPEYNKPWFQLLTRELCEEIKIDMETKKPFSVTKEYQEAMENSVERWKNGVFLDEEYEYSKKVANELTPEIFENIYEPWKEIFANRKKPTSLKQLGEEVINEITAKNYQERILQIGLDIFSKHHPSFNLSQEQKQKIIDRWKSSGCPPVKEFAPYFFYLFSISLFSYEGIGTNLIGQRPKNITDIFYLHYLPFCAIFSSNDKFHKKLYEALQPLFLSKDTIFISGSNLKEDIKSINTYYENHPKKMENIDISPFSKDSSFLIAYLWGKYSSSWRERNAI